MEIAWPESPANRPVALVASSFSVVCDFYICSLNIYNRSIVHSRDGRSQSLILSPVVFQQIVQPAFRLTYQDAILQRNGDNKSKEARMGPRV